MNLTAAWLGMGLLASLNQAPHLHREHAEAERTVPRYAGLATGKLATHLRRQTRYAWPVKLLSIGHTNASYQDYSMDPYFHHGLDIRADAGMPVLASVGGKVVNIENYASGPNYWEVAILDADGFLWQYHHVDKNSIPQAVWDAYRAGGSIASGTKIGEVVYWNVTSYGERYHHIHLNILGANQEFLSPFEFLENLDDRRSPVITRLGLMKNGQPLSATRVKAPYSLYAEVKDLILSEVFVVPPHEIQMVIDGASPRTVWRFDSLPGGKSETDYVQKYFVPSMVCGDYTCRKPVVDLGFDRDGQSVFPTTSGPHEVLLYAQDYVGNAVSQRFTWVVE